MCESFLEIIINIYYIYRLASGNHLPNSVKPLLKRRYLHYVKRVLIFVAQNLAKPDKRCSIVTSTNLKLFDFGFMIQSIHSHQGNNATRNTRGHWEIKRMKRSQTDPEKQIKMKQEINFCSYSRDRENIY